MSMKPLCYLAPIFLGLSVILAGCALDPTNSKYDLLFQITDVVNVIWTLESQDIDGQEVDLSAYEPFHLVFFAGEFFVDDGCNHYTMRYQVKNDRIIAESHSKTDQLCDVKSFPPQHLLEPYRFRIHKNELKIFVDKLTYIYRSDFTD